MGKNLEKRHILFVMETSKNSHTDTVLQSLLGRVCGYSTGSDQIPVYLHKKIIKSGEIERYIIALEDIEQTGEFKMLPRKAHNIVPCEVIKSKHPIIPFQVNGIQFLATYIPGRLNLSICIYIA